MGKSKSNKGKVLQVYPYASCRMHVIYGYKVTNDDTGTMLGYGATITMAWENAANNLNPTPHAKERR